MSRKNPRFRRANPAPPPLGGLNLYQLQVFGSIEGQMTLNNFYYMDAGTAPVGNQELDLLATWIAANQGAFLAAISSDWTLTGYKVQMLNLPNRAPYFAPQAPPVAATGPAGHEPTTVAVVCWRYTALKGQSGRGRFYMPAVPTTWVTSSTVTAAGGIAAYNAAALIADTAITGNRVYVAALANRIRAGVAAITGQPVQHSGFRPLLGTIRRRRIGRGK
jgi:hypothetical protein